jgi:hypothetical protein
MVSTLFAMRASCRGKDQPLPVPSHTLIVVTDTIDSDAALLDLKTTMRL